MFKMYWSKKGTWYCNTNKGEVVYFPFRIGITEKSYIRIYDLIIWKLRICFATRF